LLREITAWWAARMLECLPERLRHLESTPDPALIVAVADVSAPLTVTVSQAQRGQERLTGRFMLDEDGGAALRALARSSKHRVVRLRLPKSCLLERTLLLPLPPPFAADRDIGRLLGYEIDRVTPFTAAEIFWHFVVEQRDRSNARVKVRLSLVPKAPWRPLLTALAEAGLAVSTLEMPRAGLSPCRIGIDRDVSRRQKLARRRVVCVAGLYGVIGLATILLPFLQQAMALRGVERQIAALRRDAATAEALRQQIVSSVNGTDVLAAERASTGDALTVLAAVTAALPDDTSLTSLSLRQGHLVLSGQSSVAAKLIAALSENPLIRNAAFDAPTTRADQARSDLFSIRAEIAPGGGTVATVSSR
jgi:general secretion pathway protein L